MLTPRRAVSPRRKPMGLALARDLEIVSGFMVSPFQRFLPSLTGIATQLIGRDRRCNTSASIDVDDTEIRRIPADPGAIPVSACGLERPLREAATQIQSFNDPKILVHQPEAVGRHA